MNPKNRKKKKDTTFLPPPHQAKFIDSEKRLVVSRGGEGQQEREIVKRTVQMGEGDQKVQTFCCEINNSWGCNLQYGNYS